MTSTFDIPRIVAGMGQEAEYREVMASAEAAAIMAARIVAEERKPIEDVLTKLIEDLTRRREHPLAYDGKLTLAYALALHVFAARDAAGSEERLRELGVWTEDDDDDE